MIKDYGFSKAIIPINPRNSATATDVNFNENGTPLCPKDGTPFLFHSKSGGKNRSLRLKFVCPKSKPMKTHNNGVTWRCRCENPCNDSPYGKCVYIYPDKNLRLYPGLSRDSDEFVAICKKRTTVERSIHSLKDTLGVSKRKTSNVLNTKADLFLAGIVQLLCVVLAHELHDKKLARRPRRLIS